MSLFVVEGVADVITKIPILALAVLAMSVVVWSPQNTANSGQMPQTADEVVRTR
jgi:hypothetical protein